MSNVPPPVYVPEPIGYPRRAPVTPIVITIVGIVCLCLIGLGGLAYVGLRYGHPHPRKGWLAPVVGKPVNGDWSNYHLPAMGLSLTAFSKPKPYLTMGRTIANRYDISEYAGYTFSNNFAHVALYGYWYGRLIRKQDKEADLNRVATREQAEIQKRYPNFSTSDVASATVDGIAAKDIRVEFLYKKRKWTDESVVFTSGRSVFYIMATYPDDKTKYGRRALDAIIGSVKLDRNE